MHHILTAPKHVFVILFLIAVGALFYAGQASAATITWDGGGDGIQWSSTQCANWSSDTCPGAGDIAVIDTATTVVMTEGTTIGELLLGSSGGGVASNLEFKYDAVNLGGASAALIVTNGSGGNGNVTIYNGATVYHTQNTISGDYNIYFDVSGNFTIESGASINVDQLGCEGAGSAPGRGPHPTTGLCTAGQAGAGGNPGDGAGYGGLGGRSHVNTSAGNIYGSATVPD
ncbi:hypothetical protein HQ524_00970, partial [Candidatus Uhrbacteria bacterium]|nr:hypothetical protein [Candidatus Uhrbacteria bacterium]